MYARACVLADRWAMRLLTNGGALDVKASEDVAKLLSRHPARQFAGHNVHSMELPERQAWGSL